MAGNITKFTNLQLSLSLNTEITCKSLQPLLNIMFDGSSEVVAGELERLFASSNPETTSSYYRLQTFLDSELEEIDKTTLRNIRQLQLAAQQMISQNSKKIDELCSLLLE